MSLLLVACADPSPSPSVSSSTSSSAPSSVEGAAAARAEPSEGAAQAAERAPAGESAEEQAFGAAITDEHPLVALEALIDDPETYQGRVVRTEGRISAVCQRMGCWMELRDARERAVRVPMAGHSFFLPRDISGRVALVQGPLRVRPLSEAEREHLESEGAAATGSALELSATGVRVRAL